MQTRRKRTSFHTVTKRCFFRDFRPREQLRARFGFSQSGSGSALPATSNYLLLSLGLLFPQPALLLAFSFFWFKNKFFPEAGDLVELSHGIARGAQSRLERRFLLDELRMLRLQRFLLLDALTVQDGQAKLQIADLAVVALALLLETGVFRANCL